MQQLVRRLRGHCRVMRARMEVLLLLQLMRLRLCLEVVG
jgi:hypothetical protein